MDDGGFFPGMVLGALVTAIISGFTMQNMWVSWAKERGMFYYDTHTGELKYRKCAKAVEGED